MTIDEKAHRLISDAWDHFWRHCGDPSAYYEDYVSSDELDAVMDRANAIVEGVAA